MTAGKRKFAAEIQSGRLVAEMSFEEKVLAVTARIPRGRVATYGDVARALDSNGFRAVGRALHHNPYAPQVPCHRVVGSDGRLTGYAGGLAAKRRMLQAEGVAVNGWRVDLQRHRASLAAAR